MRIAVSMLAGLTVAFLLFVLMNALISGRDGFDVPDLRGQVVDFIRVRQHEVTRVRDRTPPREPPEPEAPPPPPRPEQTVPERPQPQRLDVEMPAVDFPATAGHGPYLGAFTPGEPAVDGDVMPIVRIDPQWPREALLNAIEGWVLLEFTILEDGSVADARVLESHPPRVFDRNALRALYRWRFRPRVVEGRPVQRRATQRIEFNLDRS